MTVMPAGRVLPSTGAHLPLLDAVALRSGQVMPTSFSLQAGECLWVRGASGAGKTRLLRLLADLDEGHGRVLLNGIDRTQYPAPAWRRQVLYQSAEPMWWEASLRGHFDAAQLPLISNLMQQLQLDPSRFDIDIGLLSTGERQRAALIRSLAVNPAVLLLDEPTSALDADNTARVEALLCSQLRAGMAIILVTHDQLQGQRLAHRQLQVSKAKTEKGAEVEVNVEAGAT